jgi:hypothetical protein
MANLFPFGDLFKKLSSFNANFSLPVSSKLLWQVPFWALTFLRKFKVTVAPEISQIQYACTAAALSASSCLPSSSLVPFGPPAQSTSSQPPAISAQLAQNPAVRRPSLVLGKTSLC